MNRGRVAILRRWARQGTLHRASSSSSNSSLWESRIGHLLQSPFLCHQLRGVKILGADVKQGVIIERKGRMVEVLKTQHTQQGRGGATIQVELRDLQSGLKSSERFRTTEPLEKVLVEVKTLTFLYLDGGMAVLMEPKTFEQVEIPKSLFGNGGAFLSDGLSVTLHFGDGKPISAAVPPKVTCKVAEAEPSFKGQTATAVYKKVLLDNGVRIMAPTFIKDGDEVVVNTADNSYVTRAKN